MDNIEIKSGQKYTTGNLVFTIDWVDLNDKNICYHLNNAGAFSAVNNMVTLKYFNACLKNGSIKLVENQ